MIVVTITAESPAQLAPMWPGLGGHTATVNLDDNHVWIDVDMRQPDVAGGEPFDDRPSVEELVDQLAPIPLDEDPEPEPLPAAQIVQIDRKARDAHPAGKGDKDGTCADAIVAMLASDPKHNWSVPDIVNTIGVYKPSTVNFTLAQLVRRGRISRAGRGLYRAAS